MAHSVLHVYTSFTCGWISGWKKKQKEIKLKKSQHIYTRRLHKSTIFKLATISKELSAKKYTNIYWWIELCKKSDIFRNEEFQKNIYKMCIMYNVYILQRGRV